MGRKVKEKGFDSKVFEMHAEVCKTLANHKRLEILYSLKEGEHSVTELVNKLALPKANVSQHLAVLRNKGVVTARREGINIFYAISNYKIIQACTLMREVLTEYLASKQKACKPVRPRAKA